MENIQQVDNLSSTGKDGISYGNQIRTSIKNQKEDFYDYLNRGEDKNVGT